MLWDAGGRVISTLVPGTMNRKGDVRLKVHVQNNNNNPEKEKSNFCWFIRTRATAKQRDKCMTPVSSSL